MYSEGDFIYYKTIFKKLFYSTELKIPYLIQCRKSINYATTIMFCVLVKISFQQFALLLILFIQ